LDKKSELLINSNQNQISDKFYSLSLFIQDVASRLVHKIDFLEQISSKLFETLNCNSIDIWIRENNHINHCKISDATNNSCAFEVLVSTENEKDEERKFNKKKPVLSFLQETVFNKTYLHGRPFYTEYGSFYTNDFQQSIKSIIPSNVAGNYETMDITHIGDSLAIIPIIASNKIIGLLQLTSEVHDYFRKNTMEVYESVAQLLGTSVVTHQTQAAVRERVKELACLYNIVQIAEKTGITTEEILQSIVEILPPAWQYPDITIGRIEFDNQIYSTSKFYKGWQKQAAEIILKNVIRGKIEIIYTEVKPNLDEGPFLKEERHLIDAIAKQVALILEKKEAEEEKYFIQEQLRHADRLATVGQLAAGVAHELNEPLTSILGFSQLISKQQNLEESVSKDIQKIVKSTLHARDVIKKLLLFAREIKPEAQIINLNELIEESLFLFEARCINAGIEVILKLSPDPPLLKGERSQLSQVLINLVVNSIQAMPDGGRLSIGTDVTSDDIILKVEDSGHGMSDEVKKKCFLPFFTTKDVNEGTGLGLAVVHGIVQLHNGSIKIKNEIGKGTRFEVRLSKNMTVN